MQIVITGRRTTVDEALRSYLEDRLERLEKHDPRVIRVDVEVCEEANRRLSDQRMRVELTWHGRGPVVRSEAAAGELHEAADLALGKLDRRLHKMADRRRIHRGSRTPVSLAAASAAQPAGQHTSADPLNGNGKAVSSGQHAGDEPEAEDDYCPMVVREKAHHAAPMTLDQALFEMELVGHEFYLFVDEASGLPSVVYRRRGYDYGVLRLHPEPPSKTDRSGSSTHRSSTT